MTPTVGLAIPSIPPRSDLLSRALASVLAQTRPVDAISIVIDNDKQGAAITRNRAWRALSTDYVAFLDDDDELGPDHIKRLLTCALDTDADLVFPWFTIILADGRECPQCDPFPATFGAPWDPANPVQTTITCLWKRSALEAVGGFPELFVEREDGMGNRSGEDYLAVLALNDAGGNIVHLPERTWRWHHHGTGAPGVPGNTSGRTDRW